MVSDPVTPQSADDALTLESRRLVAAGVALMGCQTDDEVFDVIRDYLAETVPAAIALVNRSTGDPRHVVVHAVTGMDASLLARAASLAGFDILGKRAAIAEKDLDRVFLRSLQRFTGGFEAYVAGSTPASVAKLAKKLLGLHDVYIIGITDGEAVFGNITILTREPDVALQAHSIESFVQMAFLTLARIGASRELAESEERNRLLFENMSQGLAVHEIVLDAHGVPCDYRFLQVNPAFETMTGLSASDVIGRTVLEVLPGTERSWIERYGAVATTGAHAGFEDYSSELGKYFEVTAYSPRPNQFATIISDITERKRAEEALQYTEKRFRLLFDQSPDGIVILDPATARPVEFNEMAHRQLGYTREEFARLELSDIEVAETPEETRARIDQVMDEGRSDFETRQRTKSGEIRDVHVIAQLIRIGEQSVYHCVWRDVTERKRAEDALRERKEFIEAVLENAPIGFAVNTIDDGAGVFVSRNFETIYGVPPGSLNSVDDYFEKVYLDPVFREEIRERIMSDMVTGDASRMRWEDLPITTQSGEHRVVTAINIPLIEQNLMISTVQDVTQRRLAEEALRDSEEWFRALFEGAKEGIFLLSDKGVVVELNAAMAEMHGYEVEEMTLMDLADLETPETASLAPARMRRVFAGEHMSFEVEHRRKDGTTIPLDVTTSVVVIGDKTYALAFHRDISARKDAEAELAGYRQHLEALVEERTANLAAANEELQRTNDELRVATAAKSDFLAAMSHELRTPMNSIIGFSSILSQGLAGPLTDEQRVQLEMVNRSGRQLLSLIDDVLDLAKIEAGKVALVVELLDPEVLVREVAEAVGPLAAEKGVTIEVLACGSGVVVRSDAGKVRQILFNLVGNAVKFTEEGSVHLAVRCEPGTACTFVVSDTGPGITAEDLSRIFEPFTQLQSVGVAKSKGTGLGLRISREYAHLLGGEIMVVSEVGEGSTFTLTLPIEPPAATSVE